MPVPRVCNNLSVPTIIKHIRDKRNLSQDKLGRKIGVCGKTVSAYEAGRIQPTLGNFLMILNVGGYSLELKEDIYKTPKDLTIPLSES